MDSVVGRIRSWIKGDRLLFGAVVFLMVLSILVVYSSTSALAYQKFGGDTTHYITKHCFMLLLGFVLLVFMSNVRPRILSGLAEVGVLASILLLILAFAAGSSINGSSRWINVAGVTFQPSEIAKVALMLFTAKMLAKNEKDPDKALWFILAATGAIGGLILLENLSTFLLVTVSVYIMLIIGRVSLSKLSIIGAGAALFVGLIIYFAPIVSEVFPPAKRAITWRARIERFWDGGSSEAAQNGKHIGDKTQVEQAATAVSTGGLAGRGPGNSYMKNFLPMAYSDFIFSTILEEYGLWGGILVVVAYFIIFARARLIALRSQRSFHLYAIYGLALMLTLQAVINMMVGVGLMPVTGQTLPMLSMGGSSNFITGATYGIMLSISEEPNRLKAESGGENK